MMGKNYTIREIILGAYENFPKDENQRKEVEDVIKEIRQYIKNNKYIVWGKDFPKAGEVIGIEIIPDLFNGSEIPEGRRMFYLLRGSEDQSYFDFFRGLPLNLTQMASKYSFNKSQDRYFEYLMAKEGIIRKVNEGRLFPSESRWYLF